MGKAGRIACIFTPILLTIASLLCLIVVGLGGSNKSMNVSSQYYFFKADTSHFRASPDVNLVAGISADDKLLGQVFQTVNSTIKLEDFYTVSLWNYCNGTIKDNKTHVDACSKPVAQYWFDPVAVWGLNSSATANAIPKNFSNALNTYKTATKWMFIAYAVAFVATVVELILGFLAIFSRWGSLFTTMAAGVSAIFMIIASSMATGIYGTLASTFNTVLKPYGIHGTLGRGTFITTWLAVLFSCAAAIFWLFSVCCCSGRSNHRGVRAEKTPYTYEMVGSPYRGQNSNLPMGTASGPPMGSPMPVHDMHSKLHAYEPYRHNQV